MTMSQADPVVAYCERWDRVGHFPHLPLTEEQARDRFAHGPWFTVVIPFVPEAGAAPRPDSLAAAPDVVLEIEAGLTTVTAVFFDDDTGGLVGTYTFRRDGAMFLLAEGIEYEAPDDGRLGLSAVVKTRQLWIQADGTLDACVDERGSDEYGGAVGKPVDVAHYRQPVPEFGDWALLARFDW